MMRELVAVVVGGLIGTGLRLGLDELLWHQPTQFPWSTLIVNLLGSFALGYLVARVWPVAPVWLRSGLGAGLLGSFTTFSAVMLAVVTLSAFGNVLLAGIYLFVTLTGGFGAALAGIRLGRRPTDAEQTEAVPE